MMTGAEASVVVGALRVQALSEHLVRIEEQGPAGFEDRETFTVVDRRLRPVEMKQSQGSNETILTTATWRIVIPDAVDGLTGVRVETPSGKCLCALSNASVREAHFLPSPSALPAIWIMGDSPRVIPSEHGALPPPVGEDDPTSGWDLGNDALDAYIFFPAASGYAAFRRDFMHLTGAVPMVPLYTLGLWYSRYYPYDEESALNVISRFRQADIPLDVFVLDTDWRVGASSGYGINTDLFPDMARFIQRAHQKQVRIMLNDHPEPKGQRSLDSEELRFRQQGLVSLLELGVDLWWFDRNWHTHLQAPVPGLNKEVWGMRLYHDITQTFCPEERPLLMSNVDGINNGRMDSPSHPAAHRFPVWWTGDTVAEWFYLDLGVRNGVNSGIVSLLPYVNEDLGGHHGQPDSELYVRFMQYGAFSPVARIHCTTKVHRYPWVYGKEVEQITGDFFRLRYRLLPMLYAAAYEAHRTGTPLLRRCDLEWPAYPEAADDTQYLLGDDLLVAPIFTPAQEGEPAERSVWIPPGEWQDAWSGRVQPGPALINVQATLAEIPIFIRMGGVVCSIPQRESTGEAVWPELIIDGYIPRKDQTQTRWLVEDDGISISYQDGDIWRTGIQLQQQGNETHLTLSPNFATDKTPVERRKVTLRVHMPAGRQLNSIHYQGRQLLPQEYDLLSPSRGKRQQLFVGSGSRPPQHMGLTVEWRGDAAAAEAQEWILFTSPAQD